MKMKLQEKLTAVVLGVTIALASIQAMAAVIVSNPLNGNDHWLPLGEPDTTTYGQTFRVPDATNTQLDSFSFWIMTFPDFNSTSKIKPYVAEWTGTGITGPLFFSGSEFDGIYPDFTEIAINTGGIQLDAGKQYVAFFSVAGLFDGIDDAVYMGTNNFTDAYSNGHFVFDNSNGAFPGATWNGCHSCEDVAFRFVFNAPNGVPEPASLALVGLGLAGLGWSRRKKA